MREPATPQSVTPEPALSQPVTPQQVTPQQVTPQQVTPQQVTPQQVTAEPVAVEQTSRRGLFTKAVLAGTVALFTRTALATPAEATEESEETAEGVVLAKTKSIPLHGGKILKGKYVVTHPAKGVFKCFTAKCTHMGCTVASVSGGTINCPCHGSRFSISDGHVVSGPATRSLPRKKIKVKKGVIRLG